MIILIESLSQALSQGLRYAEDYFQSEKKMLKKLPRSDNHFKSLGPKYEISLSVKNFRMAV